MRRFKIIAELAVDEERFRATTDHSTPMLFTAIFNEMRSHLASVGIQLQIDEAFEEVPCEDITKN